MLKKDEPKRLTALIASGAIAISALLSSDALPHETLENEQAPSYAAIRLAPDADMSPASVDDDDDADDGQKQKKRIKSIIKWLLTTALGLAIRLLVLLPLSILGKLLGWLFGGLLSGAAPFLGLLLGSFISSFVMLLTVMTLLYQSLNPQKRFYAYFKPLSLIHTTLTALALAAVNTGLLQVLSANNAILNAIYTLCLALSVMWLWHKTMQSKAAFLPRAGRFVISLSGIGALLLLSGTCVLFVWLSAGVQNTSALAFNLARGAWEYAQCAVTAAAVYLYSPKTDAQKAQKAAKAAPKLKKHITINDLEMKSNTFNA